MSPARRLTDSRVPRRRPVERIGSLLPEAARALGLEDQLRWARAARAWQTILDRLVPAAAGGCRPVRLERGAAGDLALTLVVQASAQIIGQEVRLHEDELLEAFAAEPGGLRADRLRVVVTRGIIP